MKNYSYDVCIPAQNEADADAKMEALVTIANRLDTNGIKQLAKSKKLRRYVVQSLLDEVNENWHLSQSEERLLRLARIEKLKQALAGYLSALGEQRRLLEEFKKNTNPVELL
jgi:hypothetical protein